MAGRRGIAAVTACLAAILLLMGCSRESAVPYKELTDEDPKVRMDAALRIGQAKPEDAVEALTSLLDDPDEFVRIQAAESLGLLEDPRALPSLLAAAEDPLGTVRLAAYKGLGRTQDPSVVPVLVKGLYEEDDTLRVAAAKALAEVPGDESLSALLSIAMQDEYEQVRELVVRVIGQRRVREAVPKLEGMLGAESDLVRANAALILRGLSDASSVPALTRALEDPYYKVRSLAAHALSTIAPADPEVTATLRAALDREEIAITRVDLAWSLARCGDRAGMPILREQLFRGNPEDVRAEAAFALGEVGEAPDVPLLEKAILDKKGLVRSAAAKSLEKLKETKH